MLKYQNPRAYGAWIKIYYILCSKTYSTSGNLFQSPDNSRQAARRTRICDTRNIITQWYKPDQISNYNIYLSTGMIGMVLTCNATHSHDDVIKWKHFPLYWPFLRGIHGAPVNSPHKGQWRGALMFSLICARINGWVNNGEAGNLRRHRAHYDVIVIFTHVAFELLCFAVVRFWLILHGRTSRQHLFSTYRSFLL